MIDQLISFETAKLAKEKGFDISTELMYQFDDREQYKFKELVSFPKYYVNGCGSCQVPTQSLLQKWLREVHNIHLVCWWYDEEDKFYTELARKNIQNIKIQYGSTTKLFNTYEEALETGLEEALKLITK